jgi:hypothetical protein
MPAGIKLDHAAGVGKQQALQCGAERERGRACEVGGESRSAADQDNVTDGDTRSDKTTSAPIPSSFLTCQQHARLRLNRGAYKLNQPTLSPYPELFVVFHTVCCSPIDPLIVTGGLVN